MARAEFAVPTLDPNSIPKYVEQLIVPLAMPQADLPGKGADMATGGELDYYEIAVRQFRQQVLPTGLPQTTVWSFGAINHPETFNYPAFTIEAHVNRPVRVKWINQLIDAQGRYLPHLLPVDQTLHWANPAGPQTDSHRMTSQTYTGPVPIVTHVHGAHVSEECDGYPESWFLPEAVNSLV